MYLMLLYMRFDFLEWDSLFFNKRVFSVTVSSEFTERDLQSFDSLDADLFYINVNPHTAAIITQLERLGAVLVDKKVGFERTISHTEATCSNFHFQSIDFLTPALEEMVYLSGTYSRFQSDLQLKTFYKTLYYEWITKSLNRQIADDVILVKNEIGTELGFFTIAKVGDTAKIGLLAVDTRFQGGGVGLCMLKEAHRWCSCNGINICRVATQLDNIPACKLYEKGGYSMSNLTHIYHLWKRNP